ncbi:MAG: ribose 5-phosphate isomerase A [Pedobacter sp.]|uniref:ribose 5-phosphate isomerase A n=1 Tax=Pedobacter sp. TaxID=1411316 RepID=UPI00339985FC
MSDYKMDAAKAALTQITEGQTIGLGAGSTIAKLINLIATECSFAPSLTLISSSFSTSNLILEKGLNLGSTHTIKKLDIYFDGCDQFDKELNALKSGGGIHTTEKILAAMALQFILIGDEGKFADQLDLTYPLVIEVLPNALPFVLSHLNTNFPDARLNLRMSSQKDGAVISDHGNLLVDIHFSTLLPLDQLNTRIRMIPGVVEHSLFYRMAAKAIIAGPKGIQTITV